MPAEEEPRLASPRFASACLALPCLGLAWLGPVAFSPAWPGLAGWQNFCAGKTKYLDSKYTNTQTDTCTHTDSTHCHTTTGSSHPQNLCAHTAREGMEERGGGGGRESHAERELEQCLPRIYQPKTMRCFYFFFFFAKYPIIAAYAIETGSK